MGKMSVSELDLRGKRVLMRVDFNVPLHPDGTISDDSRIKASLPTIQYILSQGASLILMSHLGRPKAKKEPAYSLAPCAKRLSEYLGIEVPLAPDCIGPEVEKLVHQLKTGQCLLLENVRFYLGEEHPEKESHFVKELAKLGDVYVNDGFGTAHRVHASTAVIARYFPGKAAAGFLMEKEIAVFDALVDQPKHPFYAVIGGAKVSSKIGLIQNLLKTVDKLFLGGGMAYTFLKALGIAVGDSLVEAEYVPMALEILNTARPGQLLFPRDLVIADQCTLKAKTKIIKTSDGIPAGWQGLDIGPATVVDWTEKLNRAATVFWNGPVGVFELSPFSNGTRGVANGLASCPAQVIIGGGDSVAAIEQEGISTNFYHLSTGGGASLEYLEFGHLPGIDALTDSLSSI